MIDDAKIQNEWYGVFFKHADKPTFSAEKVQRTVAIFDSRPITMSSDVESWNKILWSSNMPYGCKLYVYVRTANTEIELTSTQWHGPLLNKDGEDLSSHNGRILQFRLALYSSYDSNTGIISSPEISSISASCYVRGSSQVFYTSTLSLGFVPSHILLTYNGTTPANTIVNFAVSTEDSIETKDYTIIEPNTVVDLKDFAKNKFLKVSLSAIGNTEVPFVIDEFAIATGSEGFQKIS
jgi:hypothetical protein